MKGVNLRWRLGADLGTDSIGWAAIELDEYNRPIGLLAAGSRIFDGGRDPKSGESLAVARRDARAMRRRRDRFKQRQAALLKHLTLAGPFPEGKAEREALARLDPYALRARALHERLSPHEIGRALFHLNQRRGFKSNRKADRGKDEDAGQIREGVGRLHAAMRDAGAETLGEFLQMRRAGASDPNAVPWVRTRLGASGEDGKPAYDFYPDRAALEDEFALIWERQAPHHPDILTQENRARFYEVIFHQRPLKKPKIGTCSLVPGDPRLPKAHPLFQQRRLYEELNALRIVRPGESAAPLTRAQRDVLFLRLKDKRKVMFGSLRKALKLDPEARFNKEGENRKELAGDEVAAELGAKSRFGPRWGHLSAEKQWEIVSRIREQESDADEAALIAWLQETHALAPEAARAVAGARLPEGFGRFGETATARLIAALRDGEKDGRVLVYSEAVEAAGLGHHSDFRGRRGPQDDDPDARRLPYYGQALQRYVMPGTGDPNHPEETRVGRLTNPTVHIGLNQLRRVVNALIARYGRPEQVAIELARDLKLDEERKREVNALNRRNREAAEERSKKLKQIGQADKGANRVLLKLWEELNPENCLDRRCIYTGRQISVGMLFSGEAEVDHILPFSATLDDSFFNRLLCLREANRIKRKRSPWEAAADLRAQFGPDAEWEAIAARAARLPKEKRRRFEPDAMERFDKEGGFLERQLVDTQYLSRLAREYLDTLYTETGEGSGRVWVSPGRLTEMLRRSWGLNSLLPDHNYAEGADQPKNRRDHRHHAIDAIVTGVTDRWLLQAIAREAGQRGHEAANRMAARLPTPWPGFLDETREVVRAIVVSHRPDHGTIGGRDRNAKKGATAGQLHNDTAFGLTGETDARGNTIVVRRVPLTGLKPDKIAGVRDPELRRALQDWVAGQEGKMLEGKAFEERLRRFPELGPLPFRGLRRVRVVEPLAVIPIRDREGRPYKGYKGDSNYRYDVWELRDGRWVADVVSMFDAHQPGWLSAVRRDNPTARKVLSLHQNDMLAIERDDGPRKLVRVVKFGQNGQITLAEPHEAGDLKRRDALDSELDPFKYFAPTPGGLKRVKARQVRIDELGRVLDPGPRRSAS